MADYSKLLDHPDKDEIISKLISGAAPKEVAEWLKLRYENKEQAHLRVSGKLLKDFIDENIDLYGVVQSDIKNIKQEREVSASLKNNKTYKERVLEAVEEEIDLRKTLKKLSVIIETRTEQVFDKIQQNPENMKPDYALIKWCETMLNFAEKYDKIVNQSPDKIIQHNVTMQVVDNYILVFQDAIRAVLSEMEPEVAFFFMEKLNEKLEKIQIPQPDILSPDKRIKEVQSLTATAQLISGEEHD